MKRILLFSLMFLFSLFSCGKNERTDNKNAEFVMYEPSEMALLMRQIYEYNRSVRDQLTDAKAQFEFPAAFEGIHSLEMTDPEVRDGAYRELASDFVKYQKKAFSTADPDSAKVYFNRAVASCVACHETRCTGPLPKIKKLKIP